MSNINIATQISALEEAIKHLEQAQQQTEHVSTGNLARKFQITERRVEKLLMNRSQVNWRLNGFYGWPIRERAIR